MCVTVLIVEVVINLQPLDDWTRSRAFEPTLNTGGWQRKASVAHWPKTPPTNIPYHFTGSMIMNLYRLLCVWIEIVSETRTSLRRILCLTNFSVSFTVTVPKIKSSKDAIGLIIPRSVCLEQNRVTAHLGSSGRLRTCGEDFPKENSAPCRGSLFLHGTVRGN
jgi:hypothetical protein